VDYKWQYLKEPGRREDILFSALNPFLKPGDRVLDALCGYSLMSKMLVSAGCVVTGFDCHPEPIEWLKANRPDGTWLCRPVESFYGTDELRGFDVVMLLGADEPVYTPDFQAFWRRLLAESRPRAVMLEAAVGIGMPWFKGYCDSIESALLTGYGTAGGGMFDSEYPTNTRMRDWRLLVAGAAP
jgi:hypothetical protein